MPSGGARNRSGPAADINSYRQRRDADGWVKLPPRVDRRRSPNWPLHPAMNDRERELWRRFWRMGQSIVWESQHQQLALAVYVRQFAAVEALNFDVPTSRLNSLRIQADDLGITMPGLNRYRWRYTTTEELQKQADDVVSKKDRGRRSTAEQIAELLPMVADDER